MDKAQLYFRKVLKLNPQINLPPKSPKRMKKLFEQIRLEMGLGSSSAPPAPRRETTPTPTPRTEPTPAPRTEPTPAPRTEPTPAPRTEPTPAPPPRRRSRKMSFGGFGGFSMRRVRPRPRPRRAEPAPAPAPVSTPDPPAPRQETSPPPRERRTALVNNPPPDRELGGVGQQKKKAKQGLPILGIVVASVAVALIGGGIVSGALANASVEKGKDPETYQLDLKLVEEDAKSKALVANILYGAAGAAAIGAVILFIQWASTPSKKASTPEKMGPLGLKPQYHSHRVFSPVQ